MTRVDELQGHLSFFEELGVAGISRDRAWRTRGDESGLSGEEGRDEVSGEDLFVPGAEPGVTTDSDGRVQGAGRLAELRDELGDCTRCKLHATRTNLVLGVGNPDADLMFVGEAPGRDEDRQGIPFVGRAGQLLTKIIEAIDLTRDDVYIANVIKCRPPENRNPEPDEVHTCEPFLFGQVDAIRPKVIVALGAFAVRTLLTRDEAISKLRGRIFDYRGAKLVPTFHPAYLLRNPEKKREVWEDMKRVRVMLREG